MPDSREHRKTVKHYHEPGDFHEFTFSCYRRMQLLANDRWREYLARCLDDAASAESFHLIAFVLMPEHVHLLVFPARVDTDKESIARFLAAVKRPSSSNVKADLETCGSRLLQRLTVRERKGKSTFRFWQEGPGYDRNLQTQAAVLAAIDYLHLNPVRRGLVTTPCDWPWSSARWYASDGRLHDPRLPLLHRPPAELFSSSR